MILAGVRFAEIGAPVPHQLNDLALESWRWSLEEETRLIHILDTGIMPLEDSPFERGKCGYKLIQYMACGLPVVASPVGINQQLVTQGVNGFLARTEDEWVEAILELKNDPALRARMGQAGQALVEKSYSREACAPKLIELFKSLV